MWLNIKQKLMDFIIFLGLWEKPKPKKHKVSRNNIKQQPDREKVVEKVIQAKVEIKKVSVEENKEILNSVQQVREKKDRTPEQIKDDLMLTILKNIDFLDRLYDLLETNNVNDNYAEELNKLTEMKKQSKTCLRVLRNLSTNKIYYKNTINAIKKHTKIIKTLRDANTYIKIH